MLRFKIFWIQVVLLLWGTSTLAEQLDTDRRGVRWGGTPISNYTTDRGLSLGVLAERFDYGHQGSLPFETLVVLQGRYSTRGARDFLISLEQTGVGGGQWRIYTEIYGQHNRFQRYYGIGEDTSYSPEEERLGYYYYSEQGLSITQWGRFKTAKGIELQLGAGAVETRFSSNGNDGLTRYARDFGDNERRSRSGRLYLGAVWERRDMEFIPSDGWYLGGLGTFSGLGESSSWSRLDLDGRGYFPLLERRWLWLATQARFSNSSESTPLNEKARLGSLGTLRGLPLNRYLSDYSASARGELRSVWFRSAVFGLPLKMGTGIFLDTGKVADAFPRLLPAPFRWAWGFSLFGSYFTDDFLGSADFGFSKEGTAFYMRLGHAF